VDPNNIKILEAHENDLKKLQSICIETFIESFAHLNVKAALQKYLDENFNSNQLQREFEIPIQSSSLLRMIVKKRAI